jgi:hypothetical protein
VLLDHRLALVEQMKGLPELVAPRISGDLRRPEVVITPHQDLAASLGISTSALSQAIRIATIGEIDQNAAKFSLSDRQVPIRVRLPESAARPLQHRQPAGAHRQRRLGALEPRGRHHLRLRPLPPSSATIRNAASSWPPIWRPAW